MSEIELSTEDLADLADIISPGDERVTVNPQGFSARTLRRIIARHLADPNGHREVQEVGA